MWRKICGVFSHSGEDKNEMIPHYLWILSRFCGKNRGKNDCITIVFTDINMGKFSIDLASIFQFCRSIKRAVIAYIIDYFQHKLCLFTFSTKNKMADDHGVGLFLWSVHLIIWCCFIHTDHVMFIMSLYYNLCVRSYFVAAFNNLCFRFITIGLLEFIIRFTCHWHCVSDLHYSLSDSGGWSKMKVSFSVSSQSILKQFSWNFVNHIF